MYYEEREIYGVVHFRTTPDGKFMVKGCKTCSDLGDGFGPSHMGSGICESGSLASGGTKAHCTCDVCF